MSDTKLDGLIAAREIAENATVASGNTDGILPALDVAIAAERQSGERGDGFVNPWDKLLHDAFVMLCDYHQRLDNALEIPGYITDRERLDEMRNATDAISLRWAELRPSRNIHSKTASERMESLQGTIGALNRENLALSVEKNDYCRLAIELRDTLEAVDSEVLLTGQIKEAVDYALALAVPLRPSPLPTATDPVAGVSEDAIIDSLTEQLAIRDQRDRDMQEIMRINNASPEPRRRPPRSAQ